MSKAGMLALLSLMVSLTAMAISVSPAAAATEESSFCKETNLKPSATCKAGAWENALALHAWSKSTAICLEANELGTKVCGPAGEWITLDVRKPNGEPNIVGASIVNQSKSASTTVKGILVSAVRVPAGPSWHGEELAGEFLENPTMVTTSANAMNILVKGLDGNLYQRWSTGPYAWSGWQNVSALSGSGPIASGPGATSWGSGRVDVVARMANNSVGHWYADAGGWHYDNLGTEILGEPDIVSANPGYLDVFARGLDGNLWEKQWNATYWGPWVNVSAIVGGPIAGSPAATSASSGTLTIVARKPNNHVGVWSVSGSSWSYQELGGEIKGDPDIASAATRAVNIVAQGLDNRLWQIWTTGIGWSAWQALSTGEIRSSPAVTAGGSEQNVLDVVARSATNQVGLWRYGN